MCSESGIDFFGKCREIVRKIFESYSRSVDSRENAGEILQLMENTEKRDFFDRLLII